jgi:hypothetical protein
MQSIVLSGNLYEYSAFAMLVHFNTITLIFLDILIYLYLFTQALLASVFLPKILQWTKILFLLPRLQLPRIMPSDMFWFFFWNYESFRCLMVLLEGTLVHLKAFSIERLEHASMPQARIEPLNQVLERPKTVRTSIARPLWFIRKFL